MLAELLRADEEAVSFLERHGKLRLAAELAEARGLPPGLGVRQWFVAGDAERATRLARARHAFADAVERLERSRRGREAGALWLLWAEELAAGGAEGRPPAGSPRARSPRSGGEPRGTSPGQRGACSRTRAVPNDGHVDPSGNEGARVVDLLGDLHRPLEVARLGATVTASDFRGLRKLQPAAGARLKAGVVLYDGEATLPFGERLHALPLRCLWSA